MLDAQERERMESDFHEAVEYLKERMRDSYGLARRSMRWRNKDIWAVNALLEYLRNEEEKDELD